MIVSIFNTYKFSQETINLTVKSKIDDLIIISYRHMMSELESTNHLSAICLPQKLADPYDYSLRNIIEHIRLSQNPTVAKSPIFIVSEDDTWIAEISDLLAGIEEIVEDDIITESSIPQPISIATYRKLFRKLAILPPISGNLHDRSNQWGPYRLLNALNTQNQYQKNLDGIKNELIELPFWRKKIVESIPQNDNAEGCNYQKKITAALSTIRSLKPKILIVDDELALGWNVAYQVLFDGCEVAFFDCSSSINEFSVDNLDSNYDMVLLDLRLQEKANLDSSDKDEVSSLSGIRVLDRIRSNGNILPVIMATASNKSWSYETALDYGANGYWEKESPDLSVSWKYNYENTLNLLTLIVTSLSWYSKVKFIIKGLKEIYLGVESESVKFSLKKKIDTIIGQIHRRQSKYIRDYYGDSGVQTAFLTLWSMSNDIKDYFISTPQNGVYLTCNLEENFEYSCKEGNRYYLLEDTTKLLAIPFPGRSNPRINPESKNFNESSLIEALLSSRGYNNKRREYHIIRELRNHLDWIHGHNYHAVNEKGVEECEWRHLNHLLDMWFIIFTGTSFLKKYNLKIKQL
jgi:CheY-like chemotaxis protein